MWYATFKMLKHKKLCNLEISSLCIFIKKGHQHIVIRKFWFTLRFAVSILDYALLSYRYRVGICSPRVGSAYWHPIYFSNWVLVWCRYGKVCSVMDTIPDAHLFVYISLFITQWNCDVNDCNTAIVQEDTKVCYMILPWLLLEIRLTTISPM